MLESLTLYQFGEPVAQLVEHRPFKARALGSSPSRLTRTPFLFLHTKPPLIRGVSNSVHIR